MNIYQSVVRLSCCPPPSSWVVCFLLFKPQIVSSISFFVFKWWNADILDIITTPTKTGSAVSAEPLKRLNQMNHEIVHILWFFVGWVSCVLLWFVGHMLCPSVPLSLCPSVSAFSCCLKMKKETGPRYNLWLLWQFKWPM